MRASFGLFLRAMLPRPGRTPLAWRNVTHHKGSLLISGSAVAFAVLVIFMELGFLGGLFNSQIRLIQAVKAEFVMLSRAQHTLLAHETFPRSRLLQAAAMSGVAAVHPLYIEDGASLLRNPTTGLATGIRVIALAPRSDIFAPADIASQLPALQTPLTVLFDRRSNAVFGPLQRADEAELAGRRVTVAGVFDFGADYYYDGNLITSDATFFTLFPQRRPDRATLGFIQLDPRARASEVLSRLEAEVRDTEVEVLTREAVIDREIAAWRVATPVGYIFALGVAVGFVIGATICHQIIYSEISDQLPQLATMKALGYHHHDLVGLVLRQTLLLGLIGFSLAVLLSLALYASLTARTGIITELSAGRFFLVLILTLTMCASGGLLAVRRALAADPAELFQ
jgi:putative ABC transport system permease protein